MTNIIVNSITVVGTGLGSRGIFRRSLLTRLTPTRTRLQRLLPTRLLQRLGNQLGAIMPDGKALVNDEFYTLQKSIWAGASPTLQELARQMLPEPFLRHPAALQSRRPPTLVRFDPKKVHPGYQRRTPCAGWTADPSPNKVKRPNSY